MFSFNRCPRCHKGAVFRSFLRLNPSCSECGLVYQKEPGYFTGAIVASYFMACGSLIPTLIYCFLYAELPFWEVVAISLGQLVVLHPFIYRYSRLLWLHVEHRMTTRLEARDH